MSNKFKVAQLQEQGQDIIIIPIRDMFGTLNVHQQNAQQEKLQAYASDAKLKGTVCLVWERGNRLKFLAPKNWHSFFKSINMSFVNLNLNTELTTYGY